jgi:hypothetical protein
MKASNKIPGNHGLFVHVLMIFWPPIFVFSFHVFLVRVLNVYSFFPWLDIPMHYLGGLSMAYCLSLAQTSLQDHKVVNQLDKLIELVLVFTLVATIAVFWEFAEFLLDHLLGTDLQVSLPNTMQDLLMGILGAGTLVGYKIMKTPLRFDPERRNLS